MGSGATARYALEYPIGTDSVNIPSDMEALANGLDALLFSLSIVGKSANYQAKIGQLVQMSGAHIVSSPTAGANVMWGAQNVSSGSAVTVTATTGTLNLPGSYGAASISLPNHGDWAIFICDGTNHDLISGSPTIMAAEIASIASGGALASGKMVAIATSATTVRDHRAECGRELLDQRVLHDHYGAHRHHGHGHLYRCHWLADGDPHQRCLVRDWIVPVDGLHDQ